MASVPTKVASRITDGLKKFQPIVESAKVRDVNESDTVVLLTGILSDILGYDKYTEITTELAIRGTYCDLALKINDKISILIEAKAIGVDLKEAHVKQAVDYAANKGLEWVILTNGVSWKVFKILFSKPIQNILVLDIDFLKLRPKASEDVELFYNLSKEGVVKHTLDDFFIQKQATNKYLIGNLLYEESVVNVIKKELKQIYPDIKVSSEDIYSVITSEVIKREILDSEDAEEAKKKIQKAFKRKEKAKIEKASIQEKASSVDNVTPELNEASAPTEAAEQ